VQDSRVAAYGGIKKPEYCDSVFVFARDTASISEFVAETDWRNFGSGGWNVEAGEIELLHIGRH
jgi:hypothetical protein